MGRRVAGLRRGEVADLAGVSVEYYARLERGNLSGVSNSVLDALARALQLDEAERAHLLDLARSAGPATRARSERPAPQVRPSVARILELMTEIPAFVNNRRLDVMAVNPLAEALYAPLFADPTRRLHRSGLKHFHHPVVGDLHLNFESVELAADPGLILTMLSAEAGSSSADNLQLIASWAATHDPADATATRELYS